MTKNLLVHPRGFKAATICVASTLIGNIGERWFRPADAPEIRLGRARGIFVYRCLATSLALLPLISAATALDSSRFVDSPQSDQLAQDRKKVEEQSTSTDPASKAKADPPTQSSASTQAVNELAAVQVTGTRIKGGTTASPVITLGSERIQEEGFTDLGEVIRSLPQNFTGGQNPGVLPFTTSGAGVYGG
jgi:hypothetical protein